MPFEDADFAGYVEQRCPCVLVLDTSGSMQGESIDQLDEELATFGREPAGDRIAAKRVDIAVLIIDDEVETVSVRCS